jgi:hypothetical protein
MKSIALFSVVSWVLLGSSVGNGITVVQYGALGILGFVVVWFCLKGFPAILRAQDRERERLTAVIERLSQEIQVLNERNRRK